MHLIEKRTQKGPIPLDTTRTKEGATYYRGIETMNNNNITLNPDTFCDAKTKTEKEREPFVCHINLVRVNED